MNRREFLKIAAGAGLLMPSLFGCAPVLTPTDQSTGLSLCSFPGDVTDTSAMIWLRAEAGSKVAIQYAKGPYWGDYLSTPLVGVDPSSDCTAKISLDNLQPATRYYYRPSVAGKNPGPFGRFVTAPRPDDNAKVTFCFS